MRRNTKDYAWVNYLLNLIQSLWIIFYNIEYFAHRLQSCYASLGPSTLIVSRSLMFDNILDKLLLEVVANIRSIILDIILKHNEDLF